MVTNTITTNSITVPSANVNYPPTATVSYPHNCD
jgi:hypothetical protein